MKRNLPVWLTLAIALIAFAAGFFMNRLDFSLSSDTNDDDTKVKAILDLIEQEYVDTVNTEHLTARCISLILKELDPHTSFFAPQNSKTARVKPDGVIPDLGIVFINMNDSVFVEFTVPNGPGDKAGIMPGDLITTINGNPVINGDLNTAQVMKLMSGPNGSKVNLGVKRNGQPGALDFVVTRDRIRDHSIQPPYMLDKSTGYVKVNQFESDSYREFLRAMNQLKQEGAKRFVIDLRGNGGGYLSMAILMANEFLSKGQTIVSTRGRHKKNNECYRSDGKGTLQNVEIAVLIDEFSASASEVFAGAIQDNDRGLIVGRRSYGKGLVQNDFTLPDSSVIRLAVARYHTPSGRCIQKDYKRQGIKNYELEVLERYKHGEAYYRDSVIVDKRQKFTTLHGRTVYGGGGIIPDIFVPFYLDSTTRYYVDVEKAGLLQRFAYTYCENNRTTLNAMSDYKQFLRTTPIDNTLLKEFADFAAKNGIPPRWYYINMSRDVILIKLKAMIARDIFGNQAYYPILNRSDKTVQEALKALNKHKAAFPITD